MYAAMVDMADIVNLSDIAYRVDRAYRPYLPDRAEMSEKI
ncbi:3346_t:CDS:2 [Cetraspora pellucida]|uniref:3346_t:CDS:1 n=1 Tax=Cetraspora pellucida TaxID=1433469 RepID=A0ACA9KAE2_9GLOM|nr:3346_t:CDS:2 [Cetraspora pellucida]